MAYLTTRTSPNRSLVGEFLGIDPFRNFFANTNTVGAVDVHRTETGYTVELPVPGFAPEQIDVTVEDRVLTVAGRTERRQFTRSIAIPEEIDAEAIGAHVEHGLLTLSLNVHAKAQPRKIAVTVGGVKAQTPAAQPVPSQN